MKEYIIALSIMLVVLIAAAVALRILKVRFAKDEKTAETLEAAQVLCEKILKEVGLALFTEAERTYGSGTGQLKLSAVKTKLLSMLPDWVTALIDTDWLVSRIESALLDAKEKWLANDKLLG